MVGMKVMFLSLMRTGHCCVGHKDFDSLPDIPGDNTRSYNTLVNKAGETGAASEETQIVVSMTDFQAYPAYVVYFM